MGISGVTMFDIILFIASLVGTGLLAYFAGKRDGIEQDKKDVLQAQAELRYECSVSAGLLQDVAILKPDADAYNISKGLWCTDQPDLIRHHAKKERFFRLGYPEHKL